MADDTKIQWTDATWNPVRGCSRISPGCGGPNKEGGCYAEKIAARFIGPGMAFEGYAKRVNGEARWTGKMGLVEHMLDQPLRWRRPRRIFVNSMSDLFHENLPDAAIDQVFAVMALAPQHTFQILTKRADRMRAYVSSGNPLVRLHHAAAADIDGKIAARFRPWANIYSAYVGSQWPLPNVWLGVSVEDQERADERVPQLLQTPAAIRFISAEPLLGSVTLKLGMKAEIDGIVQFSTLDWVIVGGESGPRSRSFDIGWAREIVAQCQEAGVACFVKQLGADPMLDGAQFPSERRMGGWDRKGGDIAEWPEDLRVREFPT